MKRIEIVITQALDEDFVQMYGQTCKELGIKCKFTKIPSVMGQGNTTPKMGDSIWPQLNNMFIIYCEDQYVTAISEVVEKLHKSFVGEGVASFVCDAEILK